MNYKIIISPIALKNIEDAVEFYILKVSKKVALDFLNDYQKVYKALQINPFYQFHDNNYRCLPFKKFPLPHFLLSKNYQKRFF
ncbi:plasmid stabilization protein [Flavobacterium reichenbachii]|uniref:Plasmid stabilization protein n=1 Tax=Flavobacterium reichenbachii TaxID=362418 RepID=A0A085ZFY1_9FLAO|nr:plasmid stabilization protein [Flavobacterium reichenbachii]KFF03345.1 plasmid stabilization protein [Flavobacterium reichenbachii]OXB16710.1 plasmid stabilization protein [Flavobacterium reichenbachii]